MIDFMLEMMLKDTKFEKTAHNVAFQANFEVVRPLSKVSRQQLLLYQC